MNLNIHFHILFLDGAYQTDFRNNDLKFHAVKAPTQADLPALLHQICQRIARYLERKGFICPETADPSLTLDLEDTDPLLALQAHSIQYRIAIGPHQGRKAFSLRTLTPKDSTFSLDQPFAEESGFSLHAGVVAQAYEREKLEKLCRYITRPAIAEKRLRLTEKGHVRIQLKTPYRDGTTHVVLEPLDFIARLAALVPPPKINLTRFYGVFAPNSAYRARITPAKKGKSNQAKTQKTKPRFKMTWAQRLKRVFNIDIETCQHCGGRVRILASIEEPGLIEKILRHRNEKTIFPVLAKLPPSRAPPLEEGWE